MKRKYGCILLIVVVLSLFSGCGGEKNGKDFYKEGLKYFEEGDYKKAETSLSKAVELNDQKAEYYIDYGFALTQTKKFQEAQVQFSKAILDKDNKIVRENNKKAHRGKGIAYYEAGVFEKALAEFQLALAIGDIPDMDIDLLFYKGAAQEKSSHFQEAFETYTTILEMEKPKADIYGALAGAKYQMGQTEEAIEYFDKAIKLEPKSYQYYFGKYAIMNEQGDTRGAQEVLAKAQDIKAESGSDRYNLAKLYYLSDDYAKAKPALEESGKKGFYEAYFYLGEMAFKEEDYQKAVAFYEQYLGSKGSIKMTTVYSQLSSALIGSENYEKAAQYVEEGIALNDVLILPALKYNEVVIYEKQGDFKTAYEKATEYVKLYPDNKDMARETKFLQTRAENALE